jgi:periplasmic protein TonB
MTAPQQHLREARALRLMRWAGAVMLVVLLHGAGGALAIYQWPEQETDADPNGAFILELAPVPTAPPMQQHNLAYGALAQEQAETVMPTEEIKEKAEIATPPVDDSPLAPDPEVALPKPKEVEDIEEKEAVEEQQQEQKAQPQTYTPAATATAPPPIEAERGDKLAARHAGLSTKPSQAELDWHKSLVRQINRHKEYPRAARRQGAEGTVHVVFTLDRSGKVLSARLRDSSGFGLLDEEAIAVLERASPFPPPPAEMAGLAMKLILPITFNIKD